jgi:hypothetical protein
VSKEFLAKGKARLLGYDLVQTVHAHDAQKIGECFTSVKKYTEVAGPIEN